MYWTVTMCENTHDPSSSPDLPLIHHGISRRRSDCRRVRQLSQPLIAAWERNGPRNHSSDRQKIRTVHTGMDAAGGYCHRCGFHAAHAGGSTLRWTHKTLGDPFSFGVPGARTLFPIGRIVFRSDGREQGTSVGNRESTHRVPHRLHARTGIPAADTGKGNGGFKGASFRTPGLGKALAVVDKPYCRQAGEKQ